MTKQSTNPPTEEMIMTLPANALDALAAPAIGFAQGTHDASKGGMYMAAAPVGRDEPFPCFKKSMWERQGVARVIQTQAPILL